MVRTSSAWHYLRAYQQDKNSNINAIVTFSNGSSQRTSSSRRHTRIIPAPCFPRTPILLLILKLKYLRGWIPGLFQKPGQLTLLWTSAAVVLVAGDRLHHWSRAAYEDFRVLFIGLGKECLDHLSIYKPNSAQPSLWNIEQSDIKVEVFVTLLKLTKLIGENNILSRIVPVNKRYLSAVFGVLQYSRKDLVHRRNASASANHSNVLPLVRLVGKLLEGSFDGELFAWSHGKYVVSHL